MRAVLAFVLMGAIAMTAAADANDVITLGQMKFDFDAPSPPLTAAQQALFQSYKDAVNRHDEAALMALQDSSIKSCTALLRKAILRDLDRTIPSNAKVRFFAATGDIGKEMGFGDMAYLSAQPTAVLGIDGSTKSANAINIITILRPVRQNGSQFTLIPYCLTPKGKVFLEQKH